MNAITAITIHPKPSDLIERALLDGDFRGDITPRCNVAGIVEAAIQHAYECWVEDGGRECHEWARDVLPVDDLRAVRRHLMHAAFDIQGEM